MSHLSPVLLPRPLVSSLVALSVCALASGCAGVKEAVRDALDKPTVRVVGVSLKGASLEQLDTVFTLQIDNPNPIGIALAQIDYDLVVEGRKIAHGTSAEPVEIAGGGQSEAELGVVFPLREISDTLIEVLKRKEIAYVLQAKLRLGTEKLYVEVPVEYEDKLPVPRPPKVRVLSVEAVDMGLSGVQLRVNTEVENPNIFELPVDRLVLDFTLNGETVLEQKQISGLRIPPEETRAVPLDVSIGLGALGMSMASLLVNPVVSWTVQAQLEAGGLKMPYLGQGRVDLAGLIGR